jgi:uncharacterized protein
VTTGDSRDSARTQLTAVRDVLLRQRLPAAAQIDSALRLSDPELKKFLVSPALWGKTGSIVFGAGAARSGDDLVEFEEVFRELGEWQLMHGRANRDVVDWVTFFRARRGLPFVATRDWPQHLSREPVPWTVREVWLAVVAQALTIGAAYGLTYLVADLWEHPNLDLWVLVPTLFELLFLVPVWWYAIHKHHASLRSLGFTKFPLWVLGAGIGLLFAFFVFEGFYAALLAYFGLEVQEDIGPLMSRLANPWPLFITTALWAPFVEETFSRGFVFAGLRTRYHWAWAATISAALFAAAHLDLTFFIPAFLLGLLFAYLFQKSNSIWPGMIIHAALNTLAMTVTYLQM